MIHIDKHEAGHGGDFGLRQGEFFLVDVGKIPVAHHIFHGTVDIPGPAVKHALELVGKTVGAGWAQLGAPVQAGVVVGLDLVLGG